MIRLLPIQSQSGLYPERSSCREFALGSALFSIIHERAIAYPAAAAHRILAPHNALTSVRRALVPAMQIGISRRLSIQLWRSPSVRAFKAGGNAPGHGNTFKHEGSLISRSPIQPKCLLSRISPLTAVSAIGLVSCG